MSGNVTKLKPKQEEAIIGLLRRRRFYIDRLRAPRPESTPHRNRSEVRSSHRRSLAAVLGTVRDSRRRRAHVRRDRAGPTEGASMNRALPPGDHAHRSPDPRRSPGHRRLVAWCLRTGRRNCGYCDADEEWPPLRHAWLTFAFAATAWRVGQRCRDLGRSGRDSRPDAEKPATAVPGGPGRKEGACCYLLIR